MKHYFHLLFSAAILLGSLILLDSQRSECSNTASEKPDIEHMELQAEVPSRYATEAGVQSKEDDPGIVLESIREKFRQRESLNFASNQAGIRQMQVHQEFKPVLEKQSGQYIHHRSGPEDPPVC